MPVEAAVAVGTMEITVSKSELLRELTATQGVVECKTTIPILSNYLFEASVGNLSCPHLAAHLLQPQSEKRRLLHHPGAKALRLRKTPARCRHHHQTFRQSLGQHSLRPVEYKNGGHGEIEFSQSARISHRRRNKNSRPGSAWLDRPHRLRHLQ